jgi:hypothetical protein
VEARMSDIRDIRDSPQFKMGMESADVVDRFLRGIGWHTIRLDSVGDSNKAPVFRSTYGVEIAPDIEGHRGGDVAFFEVKAKTQPTVFRLSGDIEHGIEERHWLAYLQVTLQSRNPCLLLVHERSTGNILARRLKRVDPGRIGTYDGQRMRYWVRDTFSIIALKWTGGAQIVVPAPDDRLAQWLLGSRERDPDLIDMHGRPRL